MTTQSTMDVAKRVFESANGDLTAALRAAGLDATQFLGGVFMAEVRACSMCMWACIVRTGVT